MQPYPAALDGGGALPVVVVWGLSVGVLLVRRHLDDVLRGVVFGAPTVFVAVAGVRCGAAGDAGCGVGFLGAPGAPLWRVGACYRCQCT